MKGFLKILLFLGLFLVGALVLFKVIGFLVGIAMFVGVLALLGGLLYVLFGPNVQPNQAERHELPASDSRDVRDELRRRKEELRR